MERNDPIPKSSLAAELRNICIKVPLLQAIKEILICIKIIKELCLKNPGRIILEPQTIQFFGRVAELMTGCMHMEK